MMETNRFSPWRTACILMAASVFGLLILSLQSSFPAADDTATCDFKITIDAVIWDGAPDPISITFDAQIELPGLSAGSSSPTIASSKVLVNHAIEVPIVSRFSTPGRRHFHRKTIDVKALGPQALVEVFAQKTGTTTLPRGTPSKPLASTRINTGPRINWVSPAYDVTVNLKRDMMVSPVRYLPVEVKWKGTGFAGPYAVIVSETTGDRRVVHRISGHMAESYRIPAGVFESGKRYHIQVDNIQYRDGIPLTISGPCSTRSSGLHCAGASSLFTVVRP